MGEEDYMFLPSVRKVVERHYKSSKLFVIEKCGHVVNVEQPFIFNKEVICLFKIINKKCQCFLKHWQFFKLN